MAKHVLYDAVVSVNSTALTDRAQSIQWTVGINAQPAAAMSEAQDYDMPGTTFVSPIVITYYQDFAASNVWATHKALWTGRSTFALTAKATSAADSATNPNLTCTVFIANMQIINGSRGDGHMVQITYQPAAAMTFDES